MPGIARTCALLLLLGSGICLAADGEGAVDRAFLEQRDVTASSALLAPTVPGPPAADDRPAAGNPEADLAAALETAESEDAARRLLSGDPAGLGPGLVLRLMARANQEAMRGNTARGRLLLARGRLVAETLRDEAAVVQILVGEGSMAFLEGNLSGALEKQDQALIAGQRLRRLEIVAAVHNNRAVVLQRMGDLDSAAASLEEALKLARKLDDPAGTPLMLNNLGGLNMTRGEYRRAWTCIQESLLIRRRSRPPDIPGTIRSLSNRAVLRLRMGDLEGAEVDLRETLRLAETEGLTDELTAARLDLAAHLVLTDRHREAAEVVGKVMSPGAPPPAGLDAAQRLQVAYVLEETDPAAALRVREDVLADARKGGRAGETALAAAQLADALLRRGRTEEAAKTAREAAQTVAGRGDPQVRWTALTTLGAAMRAGRRFPEGRAALDEAIRGIEAAWTETVPSASGAVGFLEHDRLRPFQERALLEADAGDPLQGLFYADRCRGLALMQALARGPQDPFAGLPAQERARELALRREIGEARARLEAAERGRRAPEELDARRSALAAARARHRDLLADLAVRRPRSALARPGQRLSTSEELAALVPDDRTALLQFMVARERSLLFVVTSAAGRGVAVHAHPIPLGSAALAEQVKALTEALSRRGAEFAGPSRRLFDTLLSRAWPALRTRPRWRVAPDGPLWEVPYAALMPAPGRFLVETHAIECAPSLSVLATLQRLRGTARRTAGPALLALGNPRAAEPAAGGGLPVLAAPREPLALAEKQVRRLGELYGPRVSRVRVGREAAEDRFKAEAPDCRVLHFATHGSVENGSPLYSALLLARGAEAVGEDGRLEAHEIARMQLTADLAVLAACESGRGRAGGEGLVGLCWSFMMAGCPRTIGTLWRVREDSTTELLLEFHRQWRRAGPSAGTRQPGAAEALRRAMAGTMRSPRYRHPYYWSPFVLVGDGG